MVNGSCGSFWWNFLPFVCEKYCLTVVTNSLWWTLLLYVGTWFCVVCELARQQKMFDGETLSQGFVCEVIAVSYFLTCILIDVFCLIVLIIYDGLMLLFSRASDLRDWLIEDDDSNFSWLGENFSFSNTYCFCWLPDWFWLCSPYQAFYCFWFIVLVSINSVITGICMYVLWYVRIHVCVLAQFGKRFWLCWLPAWFCISHHHHHTHTHGFCLGLPGEPTPERCNTQPGR